MDLRHTRTPCSQLELERGIHEKIATPPEDDRDVLWWALTVASGAAALGMEGAIEAPAPSAPRRLRWVAFNEPRNLPPAYRRAAQRLIQVLLLTRGEDADRAERDAFRRAAGDCVCSMCGLEYRHHPQDPFERFLIVLCDGWRVKL